MPPWPTPSRSDLGGWVLRLGVAAFYVAFGLEKFGGEHNGWIAIFDRIGWGQWFRVATGIIEVAGGVLYVIPWTTLPAALLLSATMAGAIVAHVTVLGDPGSSVMPGAALVATVVIALRQPDRELPALTGAYRRRRS